MKPMRNLVHFGLLAMWVVAGLVLTVKVLFGPSTLPSALFSSASFWLWFAGYAAATTAIVNRFTGPLAALVTHAGAFSILLSFPPRFPFSLLRLGIDLLLVH